MAKLILRGLTCIAVCLFSSFLRAEGNPESRWYLLPEPRFEKHATSSPLPNAETTVLTPIVAKGPEIDFPDAEALKAAFPDRDTFEAEAKKNADAILSSLTPEWKRNAKQVIEYGLLQSDYPLVATVLTAPSLRTRFADILGPKLIVLVPNRYTVYLFPALASDYDSYVEMVKMAYSATPYPASLEAFEISESGIRAIGSFE